jgi:hypothetical protein
MHGAKVKIFLCNTARGRQVDSSYPSSVKAKNGWSYTSILLMYTSTPSPSPSQNMKLHITFHTCDIVILHNEINFFVYLACT